MDTACQSRTTSAHYMPRAEDDGDDEDDEEEVRDGQVGWHQARSRRRVSGVAMHCVSLLISLATR